MKLHELQARIWADYRTILEQTPRETMNLASDAIVAAVVKGMGFHVDVTGEIRDPSPRSTIPHQTGVRWSGSRRRRGRR